MPRLHKMDLIGNLVGNFIEDGTLSFCQTLHLPSWQTMHLILHFLIFFWGIFVDRNHYSGKAFLTVTEDKALTKQDTSGARAVGLLCRRAKGRHQ